MGKKQEKPIKKKKSSFCLELYWKFCLMGHSELLPFFGTGDNSVIFKYLHFTSSDGGPSSWAGRAVGYCRLLQVAVTLRLERQKDWWISSTTTAPPGTCSLREEPKWPPSWCCWWQAQFFHLRSSALMEWRLIRGRCKSIPCSLPDISHFYYKP